MISFEGLYIIYFICAILFIFAIKGLTSPKTAQSGNYLAIIGMLIASFVTILVLPSRNDFGILLSVLIAGLSGTIWANKIKITNLPQMVALLNGFGGLSSLLIGLAQIFQQNTQKIDSSLGIVVSSIAFSGSLIAFLKLQNTYKLPKLPYFNFLNLILFFCIIAVWFEFSVSKNIYIIYALLGLSLAFGATITMPILGADMPIVIAILNACSGFAASFIGFALTNIALIITGSLVGASGSILSVAMTKAMNKNLISIFFKTQNNAQNKALSQKIAKTGSPADAAYLMKNADKVIIVPGYGMAASGAQYALKNMTSVLQNKYHVQLRFAIHPVAGRMPGHMNVLLAEAKVEYDDVYTLEQINPEFETADVAYVIGANDIVNPSAKTDSSSPLYGMPILEASKAKTVFVVKRSLNAGYSGLENELFYAPNTLMLYGDAKTVTQEIISML